jgi:hypothetical protein
MTETSWRDRLKHATAGLHWVSETDAPIEPIFWDDWQPDCLSATTIREHFGLSDDTPVTVPSLDEATAPMTTAQSWHNEDEARDVERFQELVQLLKDNFQQLQVYVIGEVEAEVYVVGLTSSGCVGGVRSQIVQT